MKRRQPNKACDACRMRKTRCDDERPTCGSCRIYGSACERNMPRKKRGPKPSAAGAVPTSPEPMAAPPATATFSSPSAPPPPPLLPPPSPQDQDQHDHHAQVAAGPSPAYQQSLALGLGSGGRPDLQFQMAASPASWLGSVFGGSAGTSPSLDVQMALITDLEGRGISATEMATACIDTYVHHRFPLVPTIHVPRLHDAVALLARPGILGGGDGMLEPSRMAVYEMRSFALLTSVCAIMCAVGPDLSDAAHAQATSRAFLKASRNMLALYEEHDIEHPDSTSMTMRLFQSNTLHYFGRARAAIHVLRSACSVALSLRLHEEVSIANIDPVESQLLRNNFWALYQSSESTMVLGIVPVMMQELAVSIPFTTHLESPNSTPLLSRDGNTSDDLYEKRAMAGFNLASRIWMNGGEVLRELKWQARIEQRGGDNAGVNRVSVPSILMQYLSFCSLVDDLPPWLLNPDVHAADNEPSAAAQRKGLWSLRVNLLVTFHCLRLAILRTAERHGLCRLLGLTNDEPMLAVRKVRIARDMLDFAKSVPFHSLQANGEPCVEKLRQAGVELLEMTHTIADSQIVAEAQQVFAGLLDVIAALNSQVSEELTVNMDAQPRLRIG